MVPKMQKAKKIIVGIMTICVCSCSYIQTYLNPYKKPVHYRPAPPGYANEIDKISLLEPVTRNIIHCYATAFESTEECARKYERKNYVRFRDIPYKTANYDFLTRETYPTRRWREYERTPRW